MFIVGDPDSVYAQLRQLYDETGSPPRFAESPNGRK
jgi:alkanesulfonate monooxygenase SsuD/methylene tetrahydromethanopterin reductase-like flavin-dependent oxidoreductase (luciferase family)